MSSGSDGAEHVVMKRFGMRSRGRRLRVCVLASVILLASAPWTDARAQPAPTIALLYGSWNHTQLTVLVDTTNASYVRAAVQAMRSWGISIHEFASDYDFPAYAPLAEVTFIAYVLGQNATLSHYDVIMEFLPSVQTESTGVGGLENSTVVGGTITEAQIYVSLSQLGSGLMALGTMQSVVAHELGHALGLGHAQTISNSTSAAPSGRELMFPYATTSEIPTFPSTLDVYALAAKFSWLFGGSDLPSGSNITLPPSIPYRELGVSLVTFDYFQMTLGQAGEPAIMSTWYPEGYQLPSFALDNISRISTSGVDYTFQGWIGYGDGAYSGPDVIPSIVVGDGNITEVALWSPDNQLNATVQGLQDRVSQLTTSGQSQSLDMYVSCAVIVGLGVAACVLVVAVRRNHVRGA